MTIPPPTVRRVAVVAAVLILPWWWIAPRIDAEPPYRGHRLGPAAQP